MLMRLSCLLCFLLLLVPQVQAQPSKTKLPVTCENLCQELFTAIRSNPDNLVMRLEEALIIKESCAAELVTTAITAVNEQPALVRKIQDTALDLAPSRQSVILAAVRNYKTPEVAVAKPAAVEEIRRAVFEEVRRAELPEHATVPARPGEEVRRAQLPELSIMQQTVPAAELLNVPRAMPLR